MSDLQSFLNDYSEEGAEHSRGRFEIDREAAVAKVSAYQIPYGGDWALKVIQSAVAFGVEAIEVFQTRHHTRFLFRGGAGWAPDFVLGNFWEVDSSGERSLDHLKTALWKVGIHQKRPFGLRWPGLGQELSWTGKGLESGSFEAVGEGGLELVVGHQPADSQEGWWARRRRARNTNAAVSAILAKRAFVCPVPLSVDGRRIDYLFECAHPGLGPWSFPVGFTVLKEGEPKFRLTSLGLKPASWWNRGSVLGKLSEEKLDEAELPAEEIWMAVIVSLHMGHEVRNKTSYLECKREASRCQWVVDGVVVQRFIFSDVHSPVSVNCFLSGAGLPTDLTTMALQQTREFKARYRRVVQETKKVLAGDWSFSLDPLRKKEVRRHKTEAALVGFAGVMLLAIPPMAILVWWAARQGYKGSQEQSHAAIEEALGGLEALRSEWADLAEEWE